FFPERALFLVLALLFRLLLRPLGGSFVGHVITHVRHITGDEAPPSVRHLGDRRLPPSPRAGLRVVVADAAPAARRPHDELGLADDVLHRNRAPDAPAALHARVAGVVAVVAHDEHRPLGHGDLGELLLTRASA